jgi:hypothetical protein
MARSIWKKTLVTSFAWAGLALAQQPTPSSSAPQPAGTASATITVQEQGKAAQRCKVLKTWKTKEGASAYQVQALGTGEIMTIVETGPAGNAGQRSPGQAQTLATRIFHWGRNRTPPPGTPMAPVEYAQTAPPPVASQPPATPRYAQTAAPTMNQQPVASQYTRTVPQATSTQAPAATMAPKEYAQTAPPPVSSQPPVTPRYAQSSITNQQPAASQYTRTAPSATSTQPLPATQFTRTVQAPAPSQPTVSTPPAARVSTTVSSQTPAGQQYARTTSTPTPIQPSAITPSAPRAATPLPSQPVVATRVAPQTPIREPQTARVYTTTPFGSTVSEVKYVTPSQANDQTQPVVQAKPAVPTPQVMTPTTADAKPPAAPAPVVSAEVKPFSPPKILTASGPVIATTPKPVIINSTNFPSINNGTITTSISPDPANTKPAPAPAQPTDWRQSWGKADDHKSNPLPPPPPLPQVVVNREPAKPALPQADTKQPDPLQAPDRFTKRILESRLAKPKPAPSPAASDVVKETPKIQPTLATQSAMATPEPAKTPKLPVAPSSLNEAKVSQPNPSVSSMTTAATSMNKAPVNNYMPLPVDTMPDMRMLPVPPTKAPQLVPQRLLAGGYNGPQSKALGPVPTTADVSATNAFMATPSGAALARVTNAFGPVDPSAAAATNQGAPGSPGQELYASNSFSNVPVPPPGYANMPARTTMQAGYQSSIAGAESRPSMATKGDSTNVSQALSTLRDSLYPSERERAAESLAATDWHANPGIVPALLSAAQEDPAATVRAGCIRCLAMMKANTTSVLHVVQGMKLDADIRVRHEAELALQILTPDTTSMAKPALQPVGAVVPGK